MKNFKGVFIMIALLFVINICSFAQNQKIISGIVIEVMTKKPLPFANIFLKKQLIGTITNEEGKFDLYFSQEITNDTLLVSFIGYKHQLIAANSIKSPLNIFLEPSVMDLNEVVVRPLPPTYYIKLAMSKIKENYPDKAFETEAYYREKFLENKNVIACNEGVFKTFYPNYQDTMKNQHQLLLFRKTEKTNEIEFMKKKRMRMEVKEKKKSIDTSEHKNMGSDIVSSFGGPETILKFGDLTEGNNNFLDSTEFKNYKYSFAKSTTYDNKELMVIDFKSKGKVEHQRQEGKIYLDIATNAIVKIEQADEVVIPLLIRPLLFLYGVGIENPTLKGQTEYQQLNGKWYPKNIQFNLETNLTNKKLFAPNEHSHFDLEGIFTVNKVRIQNVSPIDSSKIFNPSKKMEEQVHNDSKLTWEGINIIKKQ